MNKIKIQNKNFFFLLIVDFVFYFNNIKPYNIHICPKKKQSIIITQDISGLFFVSLKYREIDEQNDRKKRTLINSD